MTPQPEAARATLPAIPWWVAAIVLVGALLTAAGALFALVRPETLLEAGQHMNAAAHIYAGYLISRGLALALLLLLLLLLALRARRLLAGLMVLIALIQLIDAVVDASTGRASLLPIAVVFAAAFLISATRLCGQAFWTLDNWRDSPVRQ